MSGCHIQATIIGDLLTRTLRHSAQRKLGGTRGPLKFANVREVLTLGSSQRVINAFNCKFHLPSIPPASGSLGYPPPPTALHNSRTHPHVGQRHPNHVAAHYGYCSAENDSHLTSHGNEHTAQEFRECGTTRSES